MKEGYMLFDVRGIKKFIIPPKMINEPLIIALSKSGSLSSFKRSSFFKKNFNSIPNFFIQLKNLRLKYDFGFWIQKNYPLITNLSDFYPLIQTLQYHRWAGKPIRLLINSDFKPNITLILNLFILWFKEFSKFKHNTVVVTDSPTATSESKEFFLSFSSVNNQDSEFRKTSYRNLIRSSINNSKIWFVNYKTPQNCRGIDFSILTLFNMHLWNDPSDPLEDSIARAAFPVILNHPESVIILQSHALVRESWFLKEWLDAKKQLTPFSLISLSSWQR